MAIVALEDFRRILNNKDIQELYITTESSDIKYKTNNTWHTINKYELLNIIKLKIEEMGCMVQTRVSKDFCVADLLKQTEEDIIIAAHESGKTELEAVYKTYTQIIKNNKNN